MNKVQVNKGGDNARGSRRVKKVIAANGKEKENQENETKNSDAKGVKRNSSEKELCTRKRTAFGDITNAIQSHAERIAAARKKAEENKFPDKKVPKAIPKRTSNRLKRSKSSKSLPVFPICVDDTKDVKKEASIEEEQCEDMQFDSLTENKEIKENVQNESILPDGVSPFDIDEDPDHVCEYAHSIFKNMRIREKRYPVSDYLSRGGRLITGTMRAILVDWLVEVQENFQLYHETLYVAVKLLDCYLQDNDTPKEKLQLVGATALLIACKIEERQPPPLDDFQYICDDAYTVNMFIEMEIKILKALDFDINIPISYRYLRRFSRVTSMGMEILTLARFILELSLHSVTFVHQSSSKMAAACLCLAMKMANSGTWNANHCYHSGYKEEDLLEVMRELNQMVIDSPDSKLKTVRTKYSHPIHFSVAKMKPLSITAFSQ